MKEAYITKSFSYSSRELIDDANSIIREYVGAGYDLTLRQLYYQLVSRDTIPNTTQSYKRLGSILNDARLAGLVDWDAIVDRTRYLRSLSHWAKPSGVLRDAWKSYRVDRWEGQECRPEVWIEKDALIGVIEGVCNTYDVPFFSCRGYSSQSEMRAAAQRFLVYLDNGREPIIIHLADHDPSGIDMSRDIGDRIEMFMGGAEVKRIALNMDQVDELSPPPNPAKLSDSRAASYVKLYGGNSWELDALNPQYLNELIERTIRALISWDEWEEVADREEGDREGLRVVYENAKKEDR